MKNFYEPFALSAAMPRNIFDIKIGIRFSRPPFIEIPKPLLSDFVIRTWNNVQKFVMKIVVKIWENISFHSLSL